MKLSQLLTALPPTLLAPSCVIDREAEISGIHSDSRRIQPGGLFIAIPGVELDGHSFIAAAVRNGAAAVVGQKPESAALPPGARVPYIAVTNSREALAFWTTRSIRSVSAHRRISSAAEPTRTAGMTRIPGGTERAMNASS